jgi:hypothetical protein
MIFDDRGVRDGWNTSQAWRDELVARAHPWRAELVPGLPASRQSRHGELAQDKRYRRVIAAGDEDCAPLLREFADRADAEVEGAKGTRWSYRRDSAASGCW